MWRTNLKVLVLALLVIGFYTTVAHVIPQLQSEVPEELNLGTGVSADALVAAGERIYNGAGGCTACHGLGTRAPNLLTDHAGQGAIGARCGTRGKDCKLYLYEAMTTPGAFLVPGFENIMPDMRRQISEDQIWALIAYLQSQGGEVTVSESDLPKGGRGEPPTPAGPVLTTTTDAATLITEKGCIGCHVLNGTGGPVGPPFDGMGRRLSAERIRRAILEPNADTAKGYEKVAGSMPATFGQMLSAQQLEALVGFLSSRR
ncbi:MAG TPA: c-type cytochrome [Gemmatimonadales bacterium]|jgi:mono/diheme cytochrome c family protein